MDNKDLIHRHNSRIYDNFLMHWKYVKREKIVGAKKGENKWKYFYKNNKTGNNTKSIIDKAKDALGFDEKDNLTNAKKNLDDASNRMNQIHRTATTPAKTRQEDRAREVAKEKLPKSIEKWQEAGKAYVSAKKEYQNTPLGKLDSAKRSIQKGVESVKKALSTPIVTHKTTYSFHYDTSEDAEKKRKEEEEKKRKEEEEKKRKEEEERRYKEAQDKERTEIREPELQKQLSELTEKNIFGKYKNNPFPELSLKESATTLDEDMAFVNPNYDRDNPDTSENCAYCSVAYDLRRRGYDVQAIEQPSELTALTVQDLYEDADMKMLSDIYEEATGLSRSTEPVSISTDDAKKWTEKALLQQGDGSRGQLELFWANGGAHSVIWEVENGAVMIRDCQTNKKSDITDYYGWDYIKNVMYMRTDNLKPTDEVLEYVKNVK